MPYCTLAAITAAIPADDVLQLTDDDNAGEIDQAKVDEAIAFADELIDGSLRGRYTLPLNPVSGLITQVATDIAIYRLYSRRPPVGGLMDSITDRYKNATKILDQIQTGKVSLGAESEGREPGIVASNKKPGEKAFGKDVLNGF